MELRKLKVTEEVVGVICDMCHRSCSTDNHPNPEYTHEYGTLNASWGYYSDNKDLTREECHLCEKCFDKVREFIVSNGGTVRVSEVLDFKTTAPSFGKTPNVDYQQLPGLSMSPMFSKRVINDLELIKQTEERKEKEFIEAEKSGFKSMIEEGYTREQIKETYGLTDEDLNWRLE